jgi:hypothetical protein
MTRADGVSGGCLCGGVRYSAFGTPLNVRVCHCRTCQKATGQAFFARALYPRAAVAIDGETRAYNSTPDLARHFCPRCGTPIFAARTSAGTISVALGTLDDPGALSPEVHSFTAAAIPWLAIAETMPKFADKVP